MSGRAELVARHVSPDGELVWRIEREVEADGRVVISFGFEGLDWHLHPEFFSANGREPLAIALDVTDDLVSDRSLVVISHWPGRVEYSILDDLEVLVEFKQLEEELGFRFWSGRQVSVDDLKDGKVTYKPLGAQWLAHANHPAPPPTTS
jgi:hypothetical protein